ncbi:MAG: LysR family transcriptional regulator [Thermoleophilia bacterium]|nr:LysR family transcriptional regulator [Thermoleophilia bacterium]
MDLTKLRTFCSIARKGNFSAVAEDLFMSQSAVSQQIQALERRYGVVLFDRGSKGATLTEPGRILFEKAQKMLDIEDEINHEFDDLRGLKGGELHVGASTTVGNYLMPFYLGEFKRLFPDVKVSLIVENTRIIEDQLLAGLFQLAMVEHEVQNPSLIREPIERDELILFVSPQHPWADQGSITKEELMEEPFITREQGSGTRDVIEETLAEKGVTKLNVAMELGNSSAIKTAVQAGLGVSILSRRAIEPQLKSGIIRQVSIHEVILERDFYLITVAERYASPASTKFMEMLRDSDAYRLLAPSV